MFLYHLHFNAWFNTCLGHPFPLLQRTITRHTTCATTCIRSSIHTNGAIVNVQNELRVYSHLDIYTRCGKTAETDLTV